MFAKIIFLLLFLIITFSSFGFCIRNEDLIDVERRFSREVKFFPEENQVLSIEPRQNYGHLPHRNKFTFPGKHQDNIYHTNEISPTNRDIYGKPQANTLRENPYNEAFNTGEYYPSSSTSSSNNYLSNPNYSNTIFAANGNGIDVPSYRTYNDPNYLPGNYAQNYDYLHSNRPSFNRIPNYSSRPITSAPFNRYQYQSAPPYPASFSSPIPQRYPPTSGGPFNGFQIPFDNPLANFFNNFRTPSGQFSEHFSKALEDIARNDDLQCVPKLLCQMVGNPSRRKQLPEFISAPGISALIAALPSTSPILIFGRAALLGFTGGEDNCHTMYTRCPQNEDDLLYYLNNHRGGFFRFFNGGGQFGDGINNEHNAIPGNAYPPSGSESSTGSYGFDLSNLGSNLGFLGNIASLFSSANQISAENYKHGGGNAGNLLTGLFGNYFSSKKISKRSLDTDLKRDENDEIDYKFSKEEQNKSVDSISKDKIENETTLENKENSHLEIEGRIINKKIYSDYLEHHNDKVVFPFNDDKNYPNRYRGEKNQNHHYNNYNDDEFNFKFPSTYDDKKSHRNGKKINFEDEYNYAPHYPFDDAPNDRPYRTHMIFPDRTGTGNLRFDNNEFDKYRDRDRDHYGKILNRPVYNRDYYRLEYDRDTHRPHHDESDRYRPNYSYSDRYEYERTTQRPNYSQSYYTNRYTTERPYRDNYYITPPPDHNKYYLDRYTTSRPYTTRDYYTTRRPNYNQDYYTTRYTTPRPSYNQDYYTTRYTTPKPRESDRNVYVTNSKGVVEYYITPGGGKVYV